jgi:uncharacterized membrane protein
MLAGSAVSDGIVPGKFKDTIKHVAVSRGDNDLSNLKQILSNMALIKYTLSVILTVIVWFVANYIVIRIVQVNLTSQLACLRSLHVGSLLPIAKSIKKHILHSRCARP